MKIGKFRNTMRISDFRQGPPIFMKIGRITVYSLGIYNLQSPSELTG